MRLLRAADQPSQPWKNGGGVTRPIAAFPEGAGMDDFEWRLSSAVVASDGPFSDFPGVDRTLVLLEGEGMALAIGGHDEVWLTPESEPLAFPGDVPVQARLKSGPITDLNIMVRRGLWACQARKVQVTEAATATCETDACLVMALDAIGELAAGDVAWMSLGEELHLKGAGRIVVADLWRV